MNGQDKKYFPLILGIRSGIINALVLLTLIFIGPFVLVFIQNIEDYKLGYSDNFGFFTLSGDGSGVGFMMLFFMMFGIPLLGLILIPVIQIIRIKKHFVSLGLNLFKIYIFDILFAGLGVGIHSLFVDIAWLGFKLFIGEPETFARAFLILCWFFFYIIAILLIIKLNKIISRYRMDSGIIA